MRTHTHTDTVTVSHIKRLSAPTVKRLLREAGHNYSSVAERRDLWPSLVSRVVRKQAISAPVWEDIVWALNHPRREVTDVA
jgi:hypothetical protein